MTYEESIHKMFEQVLTNQCALALLIVDIYSVVDKKKALFAAKQEMRFTKDLLEQVKKPA